MVKMVETPAFFLVGKQTSPRIAGLGGPILVRRGTGTLAWWKILFSVNITEKVTHL